MSVSKGRRYASSLAFACVGMFAAPLVAAPPVALPPVADPASTDPPVAAPAKVVQRAENSPVTITTRVTPNPSHVGDRLDLRVIAAYPQGYSVNLPAGLELGALHVIDTKASEPESSGQDLRKTFNISFQTFEAGPQQVPPFSLTYVDRAGQVHTVEVPPHAFEVESLIVNEPDPKRKGSDDMVSIDYPNTDAERRIYFAAVLLLGVGLGWWALRVLGRREEALVLPPPIPAHITAFEALDQLDARREALLERGEFQDYYLRLTEILKAYLQGRFGIDALDRTTDELRRELELARGGKPLGELDVRELIRFLQACDLVKFARFSPPVEEANGALIEVRDLVSRSQQADGADAPKAPEAAELDELDADADGRVESPEDSPSPPKPDRQSDAEDAA